MIKTENINGNTAVIFWVVVQCSDVKMEAARTSETLVS